MREPRSFENVRIVTPHDVRAKMDRTASLGVSMLTQREEAQRLERLVRHVEVAIHNRPQDPFIVSRLPHENKLLPPFQNVVAGGTAFVDLPVGFTYVSIHLLYGGTTFNAAKMNAIRVIANGQVIWNVAGNIRDTLNQFMKLTGASTYKVLTLPFKRMGLKDGADEHTALCTLLPCRACPKGIKTLRLEVDIDGTAVAPTLAGYATVRANDRRLARQLLRIEKFVEQVPALAGADYIFTHKYNGDPFRPLLHRLTVDQADTEVTNVKFYEDTRKIFDRASKLNDHAQSIHNIYAPQAGFNVWDSSEDGYSHPWRIGNLSDFQIVTTHAAGNYALNVYAETLGSLGS